MAVLGVAQRVLLVAGGCAPRALHRRGCVLLSGGAADPPPQPRTPPDAPGRFLIRNAGNEVEIARCASEDDLRVAQARFGHLPQVCVAGESNAGKSSLLNHLVGRRVSRSSSAAGKTRTVDWVCVNEAVVLTDLPGLPSRDGQTKQLWEASFEPLFRAYLAGTPSLRAMLLVHDARWRVTAAVRAFVDDVRAARLPVALLLSKDDLLESPDRRDALLERARRQLAFDGYHVHYTATNEVPQGRKSRRQVLRLVESLAGTDGREGSAALLEELVAKRRARPAPPKGLEA